MASVEISLYLPRERNARGDFVRSLDTMLGRRLLSNESSVDGPDSTVHHFSYLQTGLEVEVWRGPPESGMVDLRCRITPLTPEAERHVGRLAIDIHDLYRERATNPPNSF